MNKKRKSSKVFHELLCLVLVASGNLLAEDKQITSSVKYTNGLSESVTIWFQPQSATTYLRPPLAIGPHSTQSSPIDSKHKGKRYIVVRDESNRDTHVGWVDVEAIAKSKTPIMLIDGVEIVESVTQVYTVNIPVYETRIGSDGRPYQVTLCRQELRTRQVQVSRHLVHLKVAVDGKWKNLPVEATPDVSNKLDRVVP